MENQFEEPLWSIEVTDHYFDGVPVSYQITERFAEVIQRYSCDAYVNTHIKDIKISVSALVSLYNDYWKDE